MSLIYAMSDIHGYYDIFNKNLSLINLDGNDTKLILCGDYIDYGPEILKTLELVKQLTEKYPGRVIALMGNHEKMLLSFVKSDFTKSGDLLDSAEWLETDKDFLTVKSFISFDIDKAIGEINDKDKIDLYSKLAAKVQDGIKTNHRGLIAWLGSLPYYYETAKQIFVHAGIDEESGEFWKYGTPDEFFVSKYPPVTGGFIKDIIAGHTATSLLAHSKNFHGIFYDKKSHYYIDGSVNIGGKLPILKFDTKSNLYSQIKTD